VSDDRTTVDARVEWGNRWPDGEVEVEYGVSCPGCGWPGYMGPDDSERSVRSIAGQAALAGESIPPVRRSVKVIIIIEYGPWEDA